MANNNLGKWVAESRIDASGMQKGAAQAIQSAKGMESALEGIFGRMGAALKFPGISLGFESLATALPLQAARMFINQFQESATAAENLGFLNDQLGTSVEWLSALQTAAGESGIETQQFTASIGRLQQTLGQAALGSSEAQGTFSRLGLDWQRLRGQNFEFVFSQVAESLSQIDDRAERARLAVELFGREGGQRMLRLFQDGARGVDRAIVDVQGRGGFLTQEALDRMLAADNALDRMSTSWNNLWRDFNVAVAPAVTESLNGIQAVTREIGIAWQRLTARGVPSVPGGEAEAGAIEEAAPFGGFSPHMAGLRFLLGNASREQAGLEAILGRPIDQPNQAAQLEADLAFAVAQLDDQFNRPEEERIRANRLAAQGRQEGMLQDITDADRLTAENFSPMERFADRLDRINELFESGNISAETMQRATAQAMATIGNTTPLMVFRNGIADIQAQAARLNAEQRGAAVRQLVDRLPGLNQQAPLLGALRADSAEVGAILQASASPQVDLLSRTVDLLEAMKEAEAERATVNAQLGDNVAELLRLAQGS